MPQDRSWSGEADLAYNNDRGRHLSYQRGKVSEGKYTGFLDWTELIAFSEIQILGLGGYYGRAWLVGPVADVPIAWSRSRASTTEKVLRKLPLVST